VKNRPILLAIGIAVAIFSISAGIRVEPQVFRVSGSFPRIVEAGNDARFEALRRSGIVREVTAYNVGVREQTSDSPCIGASGKDLCRLVDEGQNVCAANFVDLGTVLRIAELGECVVLDRMHRRFSHRVDIAMRGDAVEEALEFGLQRRHVEVMD
jgi:3D (Asp-Asp-Asp) domain-containing protein